MMFQVQFIQPANGVENIDKPRTQIEFLIDDAEDVVDAFSAAVDKFIKHRKTTRPEGDGPDINTYVVQIRPHECENIWLIP